MVKTVDIFNESEANCASKRVIKEADRLVTVQSVERSKRAFEKRAGVVGSSEEEAKSLYLIWEIKGQSG